jgi:2-methylcitrate dehydratase PrpD
MRPGMSGREMLAAAVAGYEIGPRVGMCMGQEHIGQGWHSGATVGVFSAVAGAARALRLMPEQAVHAIGVAGTQSAGLMAAQYGAMVKRMHAGRSSQSGLYGALLAERGFTGIVDVSRNPYGGFGAPPVRPTADLAELHGPREAGDHADRAEIHSCVGSNHSTLDAIRKMQDRRPFTEPEVAGIMVHGSQVTMDHVGWRYEPQGLTSAQLNLPYCVATWLLEGDVFVEQFTEDKVHDAERIRVSRKVAVQKIPAITAAAGVPPQVVRVGGDVDRRHGDGRDRRSPRGSEHAFAAAEDVIAKFRKLAGTRLPSTQVEQIIDGMMNAENLTNAADFVALLAER